jgi:TonB family protein
MLCTRCPVKKPLCLLFALAFSTPLLAASAPDDSDRPLDRKPEVIRQAPPAYPYSLRSSGYRGEVVIDFAVDLEGNVFNPSVVKSSHPDFEAPAVEAVLQWKFKPGMRNGHPVYVRMEVPIFFELETASNPRAGVDVWSIPPHASRKVPAEFRYDEAPKPILTGAPVYPFELARQGVTGSALVSFAIDPEGNTHVVRLEKASRPEFGAATTAMIAAWKFEPARKDGQPCWSVLGKEQGFGRHERDFPINDSAERLLKALGKTPCPIVNARQLDAIPKPRFQPPPVVPPAIRQANAKASAMVEFIIDHAGHAQLPRVVSASDPDFGWAAATAVARWQYTVPLKSGKPVDVFAQVPVVF